VYGAIAAVPLLHCRRAITAAARVQPNITHDFFCAARQPIWYLITRVRAYYMCIIRQRVCLLSLEKYINKRREYIGGWEVGTRASP